MSESNVLSLQEGFPVTEQFPQKSKPSLPSYKFTPEELRILSECNRESFFQRSLPIGTVLGLGTYSAIQRGLLRPNSRFGAIPKITFAVILGYFIGKLSYQEKCAEKLMALPGSYIGQLLREKKEGNNAQKILTGTPNNPPSMFGAGPSDIYSDAGPGNSLDLDTDRPIFNDNDTYRPDRDGGGRLEEADNASKKPSLTYDELRRRNRGEFVDARQDPYRVEPGSAPLRPIAPAPVAPPMIPPTSNSKTNQYGDIVD